MTFKTPTIKAYDRTQQGATAPLFDRLIDDAPDDLQDIGFQKYVTENELIDSIIKELSDVFNTRRSARQAFCDKIDDDRLCFGFPSLFGMVDLNNFDGLSSYDRRKVASYCEDVIVAFEPRLKNVVVVPERYDKQSQILYVHITAQLIVQPYTQRIQFPIIIEQKK
jgi:type VI secretion system lysozyme-like protein